LNFLAVHIFFLVGFRNRVYMMFHWGWSWLTYKRGSRLITGDIPQLPAVTTIGPHGEPSPAANIAIGDADASAPPLS